MEEIIAKPGALGICNGCSHFVVSKGYQQGRCYHMTTCRCCEGADLALDKKDCECYMRGYPTVIENASWIY